MTTKDEKEVENLGGESIADVCRALGCSRASYHRNVKAGVIPRPVRTPSGLRHPPGTAQRILEQLWKSAG
jgi:hypothetical protein